MRRTTFISPGPSGVAFYRAELPSRVLGSAMVQHDPQGQPVVEWFPPACKHRADTYVVQMPYQPYQLNLVDRLLEEGHTVIADVDDLLSTFQSNPGHPRAHTYTTERVERHEETLSKCHLVTCTTPFIADYVERELGVEAKILPNAVDLQRWSQFYHLPKYDHLITIGFSGGDGHEDALNSVMPAVIETMETNEKVAFILTGHEREKFVPEHLWPRTLRPKWLDLDKYPAVQLMFDINIGPTMPYDFYRMKSDLRCLEAWAAKSAFIGGYETYGRTVTHEVNGLLYRSPSDFKAKLARLVQDPAYRDSIAAAGHTRLLQRHLIKHLRDDWRKAIERARRIHRTGRSYAGIGSR